jgi:hypothetical protein
MADGPERYWLGWWQNEPKIACLPWPRGRALGQNWFTLLLCDHLRSVDRFARRGAEGRFGGLSKPSATRQSGLIAGLVIAPATFDTKNRVSVEFDGDPNFF